MSDASPASVPAGQDDDAPALAATADPGLHQDTAPSAAASDPSAAVSPPTKGPLSFLSGALTSGALAWLALGLSRRVVAYYSLHPPHYEAQVAQSIATALKTLIVGMCFLATFSFAFVGLGLFLVFLRSLLGARRDSPA